MKKRISFPWSRTVSRKDRFCTIWYNETDYLTIAAIAKEVKQPITKVAHELVVNYIRCQKAGHEAQIQQFEEDQAILVNELDRYIKKYGKLRRTD